jgi:hypothetical protein
VLRSITFGEGTLLEQEMSDELFKPQLSAEAQEHVKQVFSFRDSEGLVSFAQSGDQISFGLGRQVTLADVEGKRQAGTLVDGGIKNTM